MGKQVRKQTGQTNEDQIERNEIIQKPRQDQYQDPEKQCDQRLNHDDIDVHGLFVHPMVIGLKRVNVVPSRIKVRFDAK